MSRFADGQVDQWLEFSGSIVEPAARAVLYMLTGQLAAEEVAFENALADLKTSLAVLNTHLKKNAFLAGSKMTLADVHAACAIAYPYALAFNQSFRNSVVPLNAWLHKMLSLGAFQSRFGNLKFQSKPLKWPNVGALRARAEEERKKQEAAEKARKEKEDKKKKEVPADPMLALPPSPFSIQEFKSFFINEVDKKAALKSSWPGIDFDGWSIWFLHYEMYTGEGEKLPPTNNLLNGFMQVRVRIFESFVATQ